MPNQVLFCITKMRYEEKRIYHYLEESGLSIKIMLDSSNLDEVVAHNSDYCLCIVRVMSQHRAFRIAEYMEALGIPTLNSSRAIQICADKAIQALILANRDVIKQPHFSILRNYEDLSNFNGKMVVKPVSSSWGRGISLIENEDALTTWKISHQELDIQNQNLPYLIQEFIDKPNYDVRIVIINTKPVVAFKRVSANNWKTNTHLGATVVPIVIDDSINKIVTEIIKVVGPGIYGLDLMKNRQNEWIFCEINQNPEFAHSWKIHHVDVAEKIAQYVSSKVKVGQKNASTH
ncbi:ATP-grasp domain-containing protein [Lactiplantibacillus plantarum]|uniref:ATP-dependent carboxylate-amine/thiol ligase family protein n=1 Tax=Lactiplantibacillus plantarum (strain ATCC BAA-793 / NCIMB 8826 / WCFS1) TaxID=220668 RepID=F9UKW6_LACPL|nr:RimK family alpha-L-glutamate ligase [Lactiplantibacillus plantarum]MDE4414905.1 RimK family alpha-L-glutamate ligase [Lactiplantibacillus plantarum]MDE4417331.1 RimK family alpha-L-glutamate ligase [Lactiplantibacillus plantarum]MDE4420788.1 RimK family alpha-L-glutamate ligase [Lactiplantibacillus plantarum]MDE4423734.1 RimK family alpha-L-glutamate ligase [Lactiplantibacillus plantarum]MDE4426626.1 RimK family alpha-L-glutamate ligase [Lactiplantibacillus plantarum]